MDCEQVKRKYKDYLLGKLAPHERESVAGHIQDCADCFVMDREEKNLRLHEVPPRKWAGNN